MPWHMELVIPGLYIGNISDSKDLGQLETNDITHIISIHDNPRRVFEDKQYLCIIANDAPHQNIIQYFSSCNDFIHEARINKGNVLVHCLAGMSRSVTIVAAYIMSITDLCWKSALEVVRVGRACANPNMGFIRQLQNFGSRGLAMERTRLERLYPTYQTTLKDIDMQTCVASVEAFKKLTKKRLVFLQMTNLKVASQSPNSESRPNFSYTLLIDKTARPTRHRATRKSSPRNHVNKAIENEEYETEVCGDGIEMPKVSYYSPLNNIKIVPTRDQKINTTKKRFMPRTAKKLTLDYAMHNETAV